MIAARSRGSRRVRSPTGKPEAMPSEQGTMRRKLDELFGIDLRTLAAYRMALGLLILVDLGQRARFLPLDYTDTGPVPRSLIDRPWAGFMLHSLGGSTGFQIQVFVIAAVCAVILRAGKPR